MENKRCRFPGIEEARRRKGLSQDAVAAFVGMKKDWYQRIQKYEVDATWGQILRIAAALGISLSGTVNFLAKAAPVAPELAARDHERILAHRERQAELRAKREGGGATAVGHHRPRGGGIGKGRLLLVTPLALLFYGCVVYSHDDLTALLAAGVGLAVGAGVFYGLRAILGWRWRWIEREPSPELSLASSRLTD